jgi:spore maturation protein CgeB
MLKILWLYQFLDHYNHDDWLHMKFAEYIANSGQCELVAYGPGLHENYRDVAPIKYNQKIMLGNLYNELRFDAVIINTKSRCFDYYNPHKQELRGCWLAEDFSAFDKTPKLVLEEDYHYELNDTWYQEQRIDLILQRHYAHVSRQEKVPMKWLPFSVDTTIFKPSDTHEKINKVCMAGAVNGAYPERQIISNALQRNQLIDVFSSKEKIGLDYVKCLQQYTIALCGSSRYHITPAKLFEIMASGAVLFTSEEKDLEILFDKDSYITYNINQSESAIVQKVREILNNINLRDNITSKALKCINEKHTHDVRIKELIKIIEDIKK